VFNEYAQFLRERYPALQVEGGNYPPPPMKATAAQVLSFIKIAFIIAIISGQDPFAAMGMQTPTVYTWAITNKVYACMMLFFIGNAVEGQLISTGAFEVSYNDMPVWSKLETGRVPSPQELMQIIDSNVRMSGGASGAGQRVDTDGFKSEFDSINL
jgi:selT/selW/selH-like putative selenoprotein